MSRFIPLVYVFMNVVIMAAILQLIIFNRLTKTCPWFTASFFDIGHPCYGQSTPLKTILRDHIAGSSLDLFKLTAAQVLVFDWIAAHVRLTCCAQGRVVRKPVIANPEL